VSDNTNKDANEISISEKVPGRTIGLSVMCAMIVFVAFWMSQQESRLDDSSDARSVLAADAVTGFRQAAWYLADDELLGFVQIPEGVFRMGSNPALDRMAYENERWSSSQRQGSLNLPDYYIARYELTVAQFNVFAQETSLPRGSLVSDQSATNPVANVTWPEALAYARWLETKLRESDQTPLQLKQFLAAGAHVTLPSEAEWEKAARGTDARIFPWGSQAETDFANYAGSSVSAVGSFSCPDCAHGLADMSGNVWELTRSPMQAYPYDSSDDADNLGEDALWVMRGGSYSDAVNNVRAAVRGGVDPGVRNSTIGFRVVISTL